MTKTLSTPSPHPATLTLLVALMAGSLLLGCGSELTPPPGWQGTTTEPDAVEDTTPDTANADADADAPADVAPECTTDEECEDKFALFPCQFARCDAGECVAGTKDDGDTCDDGDPCSEGELCETGICVPQSYVSCDDGDPCTDEACDSDEGGCVFTPKNEGFCNDGEACTIGDSCVEGACVGTPTNDCYSGSCCEDNGTPGCDDQAVRQCVCAAEPGCCALDSSWNQFCVNLIESTGCGFCPVASCGDGTCDAQESCTTCPADCGFCASCGDGTCGDDENCFSCYTDCGECSGPLCGDLLCKGPSEDCQTCAADCGACTGAICGDGTCELNEQCQNCPADCGECQPGCGDGICTTAEGCENCPIDCGICVGNCCTAADTPGCDQVLIQQCVCEADDYCCNESWDGVCVAQVETEGCAQCTGVVCGDGICTPEEEDCNSCPGDCGQCPFCGDGVCQSESEDCDSCTEDCGDCISQCCSATGMPGCGSPTVEACVCQFDSFCCNTSWDSACASAVETYGCGSCSGGGNPGGGGGCCQTSSAAGCSDASIEACVCAANALCCFWEWDASCVDLVTTLGCGTCP